MTGRMLTDLVPTHFELGHVPGRVFVRWALNVTELGLVRCEIVLDVERQLKLEELVTLVPVDFGIEAEEGTRVLLQRRCIGISPLQRQTGRFAHPR